MSTTLKELKENRVLGLAALGAIASVASHAMDAKPEQHQIKVGKETRNAEVKPLPPQGLSGIARKGVVIHGSTTIPGKGKHIVVQYPGNPNLTLHPVGK